MKRGFLARIFSRATPPSLAAAAAPVRPGPVAERWVLLAPCSEAEERVVSWAAGLREAGCEVLVALPEGSTLTAAGTELVPLKIAALRPLLAATDQRLRVLVTVPDACSVAFAREAHVAGARVVYDKIAPNRFTPGARAFHLDDERALVLVADDRVAPDRATVRLLASLAGSGRIVHEFADATAAGRAFPALVARPSIMVVVADAGSPEETGATIEALHAMRGTAAYRIVVVMGPEEGPALKGMLAREEAGEILLLRDPRASLVSALAMGARATGSEVLVFLRAGQLPTSNEWLETAAAQLYGDAALGALQLGESAKSIAAPVLPLPGLVLRRAVFRDTGGFTEGLGSAPGGALDFSLRLVRRGFRLAQLGQAVRSGGDLRPALADAERKKLRAHWSATPEALRAALDAWKSG